MSATPMIKVILLTLAALVVVILIVAAFQPKDYKVERSVTIAAPAPDVFKRVNHIKRWQEMSPWAKIDLNTQYAYKGPDEGVGAEFHWVGNSEVGEGNMAIVESRTAELVRFNIDFVKPFAGKAVADFIFKAEGGQTKVTWAMTGEKVFITKVICLFVSMDKLLGPQFESGLAELKRLSEAPVKQ